MAKADPSKLSSEGKSKWAKEILALKAASEPRPWELSARPKQLPPDHPRHHLPWTHPDTGVTYACGCDGDNDDWTTWIFLAGRGTGKTKAGAEWAIAMALSEPGIYVAVCAPTFMNVRATCFEDLQSGIIASARPGEIAEYNRNDLRLTMRNGSIIRGFSAENVDSVRGANLSYCWFDELASIKYIRFFDYGLKPAMRIRPKGNSPRMMITTTPSSLRLIRDLLEQAKENPKLFHVTAASSSENPYYDKAALDELRRQYAGTRLERQELEGQLIEGADGALFSLDNFGEHRVLPGDVPELRRVVVAIDPATTSTENSDETGIVVAGEGPGYHYYTLEDCSLKGSPDKCMTRVVEAYHRWEADCVVGENTVGDYMPELLSKKDPTIPYKSVAAMKAKFIRAESIAALAEQGRIHMAGVFEELEKQLCAMTAVIERSRMSDDHADAWVWAMRELSRRSSANYQEAYGFIVCENCGKDVNYTLEKECRHCHEPVPPREKEKVRDRAVRWASAYRKTCAKGHEYPMKLDGCPQCGDDPQLYMAQVAKLSGSDSGWHSYTSRDWFRK